MQDEPYSAVPILGVIIVALIPGSFAVTLQSQLAWYSGFGLYYGAVSVAEMGYLAMLVFLHRMSRPVNRQALR